MKIHAKIHQDKEIYPLMMIYAKIHPLWIIL